MYRYFKRFTSVCCITLFMICMPACESGYKNPPPIKEKELYDIIVSSGDYLVRQVKPNGMFEYQINLRPAVKVRHSYNILRHAGTIYSLAMYYELNPNKETMSAILKSGEFLRDKAIGPVEGEERLTAVWSDSKTDPEVKTNQAKLGGAGLGLVALLKIEMVSPGFTPLSTLQSLGRFIVFMQKPNGGFYSKFSPSEGGRDDSWTSLYYPGEAALGLMMLYQKDKNEKWLKAAIKAMEYLALDRKGKNTVPPDHWALLATEQIFKVNPPKTVTIPGKLLKNHAIQICNTFLKTQITDPKKERLYGSFLNHGRTTPTSTRLEGLIAAHSFLSENTGYQKKIVTAISKGIVFLSNAQIKDGEFSGAIPMVVGNADGAEKLKLLRNPHSTNVRIDYVQHALSAFIGYLDMIKTGEVHKTK